MPTDIELTTTISAVLIVVVIGALAMKPRERFVRASAYLLAISAIGTEARTLMPEHGDPAHLLLIGSLGLTPWAFLTFCRALSAGHGAAVGPRSALRFARAASGAALACAAADLVTISLQPGLTVLIRPLLLLTELAAFGAGFWLLRPVFTRPAPARGVSAGFVVAAGSLVAYAPALALNTLPQVLGARPILPSWVAAALLLALPASMGFASVRWRAGSLVALIDRLSVYGALALILVLGYVAVAFGLERMMMDRPRVLPEFVTLCFAAVAAVTYAPLKNRTQRLVDVALYRDHYDLGETLQRYSQELAALRSRQEVVALLLDGLTTTLNLTGMAFVALPEGLNARVVALIEEADLQIAGWGGDPAARARIVRGLQAMDLERTELSPEQPVLRAPWPGCAALVVIGAGTAGAGGGVLVVGPKKTGTALRDNDYLLLATLAHQAATALANAALLEGLRTSLNQVQVSTAQLIEMRAEQQLLLRRLVDSDERQRAALAHELHDDALQEVLYLVRHSRFAANIVAQMSPSAEAQAMSEAEGRPGGRVLTRTATWDRLRQELDYLAERSLIAEQRLRALCLGLYPALLSSLGLYAALEELARELASSTDLAIRVSSAPGGEEAAAQLDDETALHVYRIVQEALRNAVKHAGAAEAAVHIGYFPADVSARAEGRLRTPHLEVQIDDTGRGVELPVDFARLLREGHLGLAGMRARAERIGGALQIAARPGGGTRITVRVPLPARETQGGSRV